jgi:hypothetical protein
MLLNMHGHGLPNEPSRPFSARIPPDLPWQLPQRLTFFLAHGTGLDVKNLDLERENGV